MPLGEKVRLKPGGPALIHLEELYLYFSNTTTFWSIVIPQYCHTITFFIKVIYHQNLILLHTQSKCYRNTIYCTYLK